MKNGKDTSTPQPQLRNSPAVNVVRPILLAAVALAAYNLRQASPTRLAVVAAVLLLGALVAFVTHTAFSRRKEESQKIRCG